MTVAVHAMFLWAGFIDERGPLHEHELWGQRGGQIEAAQSIAKWAEAIEAAMRPLWERKQFAGVFDYEVSEVFGLYLRDHPDYSDRRLALGLLLHIERFFQQGEDRLTIEELTCAHDAILSEVLQ